MTSEDFPPLDAEAIRRAYDQHAQQLSRYLIRLLKDRELAAEAAQSTFERLLEQSGRVNPKNVRGWLFRVAFNEAMLHKRRSKLARKSQPHVARQTADDSREPGHELDQREEIEQLQAALERLPETQQTVVRLRIYEELTFQQIADRLQTPLGTVLSRMQAALKKLSEQLQQREDET